MHRFRHRAALRRIRRKERIAGTGSEDHDAALFQILQRTSANVRFGNLRKRQSALHAGFNAGIAQRVLQGHGVHDRGKHTHVVARGAIHAGGAESHTAEDVAAAHNDAQFDAEIKHALDFLNDARKRCTIDTELIRPHQGFAGKLQKNALVLGRGILHGHIRRICPPPPSGRFVTKTRASFTNFRRKTSPAKALFWALLPKLCG